MHKDAPNSAILPDVSLTLRVFVKRTEGQYLEITGIQSFERSDFESDENNVTFTMQGKQNSIVTNLLSAEDRAVDVRMEFFIGATMVMTFSGAVVNFSDDTLTISMLTPISTEVEENPVTLH
jgi:hypothetical protein